jgi:arylsulfatase A-like enzyme
MPNVVFLLADDLGFNSIGNEDLDLGFATPFLSKLAGKGVTMSNYYTQESCTPARAALLTGRYPLSLGMQLTSINAYQTNALDSEEALLSDVLKTAGYTSYHLGKWNLGHYHPKYLPTARGFDYFLGYGDGQTYYWSKKNPKLSQFTDLTYGNSSCYSGYDGEDRHDYSTFLYRDKAVKAIEQHDYESSPMFMYVAFQAVHDPFYDYDEFTSGIPPEYLGDDLYAQVMSEVAGRKRRQYAMALYLLDGAVETIYDALNAQGQLDNTYIIFTSDNGACYGGGGKNGPYRGSKGSLWEGGTKVDAFVYSPMLSSELRGLQYSGLMHVTDWFPTILDMTGVSFTADEDHALDGVSHWGFFNDRDVVEAGVLYDAFPREYLLYNYIIDVGGRDFALESSAPVAVRNQDGIKLIHAYVGNPSGDYFDYSSVNSDDASMSLHFECTQSDSISTGDYALMLFDLSKDPYETTNLYDDADYADVKKKLYAQIDKYYDAHTACAGDGNLKTNKKQKKTWKEAGNFIVPWALDDLQGYPSLCASSSHPFEPIYERVTDAPTPKPSKKPTHEPSFHPTHKPSHQPSSEPSFEPSSHPSHHPSTAPTEEPSEGPTAHPSHPPSGEPTFEPSSEPSQSNVRTLHPSLAVDILLTQPPSPSTMLSSPPSPSLLFHQPSTNVELSSQPSPSSMFDFTVAPTTRSDLFLSSETTDPSVKTKKDKDDG